MGVPAYVVGSAPDGLHGFDELVSTRPLVEPGGDLHPTDADGAAVLIYTSGTTGKPKGAELTHFQLYMNCSVAGSLFGARSDDVTLAVLPFFHVFGLSSVIGVSLRHGGSLAILPRFDLKVVPDTLEVDRVTVIGGVPTMLHALAESDVSGRDLSALRVAVSGGASLPGEVMHKFEEKYGIVVLEGYGLSETAATTSFNRSAEDRKLLSIGKPIWGVQMRIVDPDEQPLPVGKDNIGEIVVRGHNVMKGYLGQPEKTAEAMKGGWFHTGDLGYVDDEGFYFVVDRRKDLVIRGGYNVYPREIEEVLFEHPAILEAAVIGYCKERLAAYKYPREIRFVEALPKGPTGKILKAELRKIAHVSPVT